jgi:hypothetical protein
MPRPEYSGVSLKKEVADTVNKFINDHPTIGYRSTAQFIEDAVRQHLTQLKLRYPDPPRFEKINADKNGTKIHDRQLREVVQICITPNGIFCEYCETENCEHVAFALTCDDIIETIWDKKEEGWKVPDV